MTSGSSLRTQRAPDSAAGAAAKLPRPQPAISSRAPRSPNRHWLLARAEGQPQADPVGILLVKTILGGVIAIVVSKLDMGFARQFVCHSGSALEVGVFSERLSHRGKIVVAGVQTERPTPVPSIKSHPRTSIFPHPQLTA